jgi:hypothetical protein
MIKTAPADEVARKNEAAEEARAAHAGAVEAAHAAAELVATLEERVRNSDTSVTHEHLAEQQSRAHWARLNAEAAERRAETARLEAEQLVSEAVVAEARKLLSDHSLKALAEVYDAAVNAVLAFVDASEKRRVALDKVMALVPEFDDGTPAHVRAFEGTVLNPPADEFPRAVLDVLDDACARIRDRRGNSLLDVALDRVNIVRGHHSTVRTIAEGARK